jgi:hypothetical protein
MLIVRVRLLDHRIGSWEGCLILYKILVSKAVGAIRIRAELIGYVGSSILTD